MGARERRRRERVGGYGGMLGNAITSILQELFVIYAYRELFTSYTVSANQRSITLATSIQNRKPTISFRLYLKTSRCLPFSYHYVRSY